MINKKKNKNQLKPISHSLKKMRSLYVVSTIVVVLAIFFSYTNTNFFITPFLKLTQLNKTLKNNKNPISNPQNCVLWMAPFLSGGGYSSEAWSYITALTENNENPSFKMSIYQHGDLENIDFWDGLPERTRNLAIKLYQTKCEENENTIVVCHSEPGAWYPPLFQTVPCPPIGYGKFKSVIGRTMFETDRLNNEHVKRCNKMDFIWVPTDFHISTFIKSGVKSTKVAKIVQPVDVDFFDPLKYEPLDLESSASLVFGNKSVNSDREYRFLSIFKWEYRKGWDVLLRSYLKEFSAVDNVALYLVTNLYHSGHDFGNKIIDFIKNSDMVKPVNDWAPVYVIDTHIPQIELPRLCRCVNAFVLPSRGEGWGRPIVEAMAMSLPVITTNWSGPTEFITEENSYPIEVASFSEVLEGPFKGHLWAEPSVDCLRVLMRRVMTNIEEGKDKGRRGRDSMITKYSPEVVAGIVSDRLEKIFLSRD